MSDLTIDPSSLIARLNRFKNDPISIQNAAIDMIGSVANINAGHPFSLLTEMSSVMTSQAFAECMLASRMPYPQLAESEQELYLHMSDEDYLDRFAIPANTTITFWVSRAEFLNAAVVEPSTGVKKLVFPKNTQINVGGTPFTFVYPVELIQLKNGAIKAYYDISVISPMMDLATNEIELREAVSETENFLVFSVKVLQMSINSTKAQASAVKDLSTDIKFSDQFFTARAYIKKNGKWTEINTTHSDLVYDLRTPTVVLKVTNGNLNVSLPQVYYNKLDSAGNRLVDGDIRIDVYTTRGDISMSLEDFELTSYSAKFSELDDTADPTYWKPVSKLRTLINSSKDFVSGGRNALSFDELLQRIVTNSIGPRLEPITDAQVQARVEKLGYSVIRNIDNLNTRTFVAMRDFPAPADLYPVGSALPRSQTPISATIQTAYFIMENLAGLPGIIDNDDYMTISSDTIVRIVDGNVRFLTANDIQRLRSLSPAELTQEVSYGNYLFIPFHYVLDKSDPTTFAVRAYHLDKPDVTSKSFIAQNNSSGLHASTASYNLELTDKGYVLLVRTKSSDEFRALPSANVFAQLSFVPKGEQGHATVLGTLIEVDPKTHERTYAFELNTKYVIDASDHIRFTNFNIYGTSSLSVMSGLTQDFSVIYGVASNITSTWSSSNSDNKLNYTTLPATAKSVTEESFRIHFGNPLTDLWKKARVVPSPQNYATYTETIYQTYPKDIFKILDENGSTTKVMPDGSIYSEKLHSKGDFVLDQNGNKQILYHAGEVKLGDDGKPILVSDRKLLRQVDLFALEAPYRFATNALTRKYKADFLAALVKWITSDLETVSQRLMDQSRIYFSPKKAVGTVTVIGPDNVPHVIDAATSFVVTLYVDKTVKADPVLKAKIEASVVKTIANYMDRTELNLLELQRLIKDNAGKEVITLDCTGFGPGYKIVSIVDPTNRLSVRKRLSFDSEGYYDAVDDITCNFAEHQVQN